MISSNKTLQRLEKMGSIRRKLHNDLCKNDRRYNEDNVTIKKIKRRRDDDFEQSSSSANALRTASSYMKH